MKINSITINFWYKELLDSPSNKVFELEDNLNSLLHNHFMYSDMPSKENIDIPRVQCISDDKKIYFTMSLVSATLTINVSEMDKDDIVLFVNENIQLLYDVLKDLYNIEIIYSSIKLEATKQDNKVIDKLVNKLSLGKDDYEDLSFKEVKKVDDTYYECIVLSSSKEINFDIQVPVENPKENDLYTRSMLISTSEAKVGKVLLTVNYEINDRLSYNNDKDYLSTKESIRGLIIELKDFVEKRLNKLL
jgi:hypothetical protein